MESKREVLETLQKGLNEMGRKVAKEDAATGALARIAIVMPVMIDVMLDIRDKLFRVEGELEGIKNELWKGNGNR